MTSRSQGICFREDCCYAIMHEAGNDKARTTTRVAGKDPGFTLSRRPISLPYRHRPAITRERSKKRSSSCNLKYTTSGSIRTTTRDRVVSANQRCIRGITSYIHVAFTPLRLIWVITPCLCGASTPIRGIHVQRLRFKLSPLRLIPDAEKRCSFFPVTALTLARGGCSFRLPRKNTVNVNLFFRPSYPIGRGAEWFCTAQLRPDRTTKSGKRVQNVWHAIVDEENSFPHTQEILAQLP